jgi:chromosome segregation ATPase
MVEGEHLLNATLIQLLRLKKPFDVAARLKRARAMAHVTELIGRLLSFDPKDRCSLEWLQDHPYIKGHSYMLKFRVFVVNRATSQDLTLQVSPASPIDALIEELNTRVPPFVKGRQGASVYAPPGSSSPGSRSSPPNSGGDSSWEKPRPVLRIYLFEDGSPVHIPRSLEDLMKQREIYVFHLEDSHSDFVVEDDFVLVDSADFGSSTAPRSAAVKSPGGALDEVNRHLVLRSKQSSALTVLMRYLNVRYSELEEIERTLSLAKLVKEERDRLKMILLVKLKDLAPKNPSASYDYFDQFWVLLAQIEQLSRKLDVFDDDKKRLVDKLLTSQAAVSALVNSVERAQVKRDQLKKMLSSPSLIDGAMAGSFRDWVVDELNNRDKTREIKLLTSSIVQSHMAIDSISLALSDIRRILSGHSQSILSLRDSVQSAIEKNRDLVSVNETELRSLQNEISQLKHRIAVDQEKILSVDSERASLDSQVSSLKSQLESAQRRISLLEDSMLERNKLSRDLEAEKAASAAVRDEAKLIADSLIAAKAEQTATEAKLVEIRAQYDSDVSALRAELDDMKSQLERIQVSAAQGLVSSGSLTKSQGEGIVDIVLANLDEKNKELEDVKTELQKLQSDFVDEKQAKRQLRELVQTLEPIKVEYDKLVAEAKLLKMHTQQLESDRVCFNDFEEHSVVLFALHPSGFYYMMYEPAQSAAQYCWVLIDPFQELPGSLPSHMVAELLTIPQFDQVTKVVRKVYSLTNPCIADLFSRSPLKRESRRLPRAPSSPQF